MVLSCRDYASACLELGKMIAQRYPGNPDVLDSLTIAVLPCRHQGSTRKGHCISAWPTAEGANDGNAMVVYFGDPPVRIE